MTLSINSLRTLITVSSDLLDDFVADPSLFADIVVEGFYNNTETSVSKTYTNADPIDTTTDVATSGGVETIKPSFFSGTTFGQGVYRFIITLTAEAGIYVEEGCLFVEDDLGCTIDDYRLTETNQFKKLNAGIDYFILKNTATCQCGCNDLIEIYNNLITQTSDTNCTTC